MSEYMLIRIFWQYLFIWSINDIFGKLSFLPLNRFRLELCFLRAWIACSFWWCRWIENRFL